MKLEEMLAASLMACVRLAELALSGIERTWHLIGSTA